MFINLAGNDVIWAVGSVFFVFCYFIYHLKSVVMAMAASFLIAAAFPLNALINQSILGNTYYISLHSIAIFIMLGIAADDVFVLVDGFRQTEYNKVIGPNLKKRLAFAFRRAGRATATTSATTAAAFMGGVWNPLMPMASFGIYCSTLVIVTYALIILFFPPVIVYVELYLKDSNCPDMSKKNRVEIDQIEILKTPPEPSKIELYFSN